MKKILFFASAIAGLFFAASCQQENLEPVGGNTVTYTVQVPEALSTKVIGENVSAVRELVYEVYRVDAQTKVETRLYYDTETINNGQAIVELELVNNQDFRVLFWAQVPNNGVYEIDLNNKGLTEVKLNTSLSANAENYAAFANSDFIKYGDPLLGRTITLVRPISQLNIATTSESLKLGEDQNGNAQTTVSFESTGVSVKGLSTTYNVATGKAGSDKAQFTYSANKPYDDDDATTDNLSEKTLNVNGKDYTYVSMNYVGFAQPTGDNVEVTYTIVTDGVGKIENTISNVPVKANYRTNIIGNLITSTSDYTINLSSAWAGEEVVTIWDGKTVTPPAFDEATKTWQISNGAELAWISHYVNGTLSTKAETPKYKPEQKFVLTRSINLGGQTFIPIGVGDHRFSSTFDGAGHTIENFTIDAKGHPQAALFANVAGTPIIKNLTVKGAKVVYPGSGDYYGAGLIATAYGNVTIENVIIEKCDISGNNKVAGLLAHDGIVSSLNINNCHVRDCKISSVNNEDGGNVGGLVGLLQAEITHSISNSSVKNTVINAINSTNTGKRANGEFVACAYGKLALKVVINNCEVSGNTFNQNEGVTYVSPFGVFVGGYREITGEGAGIPTVIVNDKMVAGTAEELANLVNNATSDIVIELTNDIEGKIRLNQNPGVDVTILGNGNKYTGGIHIFGNGASDDRSMTIKGIDFDGTGLTDDEGCIYTTGKLDPNGPNSYACNVTIENCTFTGEGVAAIRQNVGGERDWTIKNCTVANDMHSFLQIANTEGELVVEGCNVYSKNGANLNSTCVAKFTDCEFDVRGYAVRVGVNSGGNPDATKVYTFTNCTLTSQNQDGDAVVIIRKDAKGATLNFVNTVLNGTPMISGNTSDTKINGIELPQQNNEIWYTATAKVEARYYDDRFGTANFVSNEWDEETGKGVITFDAALTKVGTNAFYEREDLRSVSFPDSVTEIGNEAFSRCKNLASVEFGSALKSFGNHAFQACGLTEVVIPEGVETIGDNAFNSCISMTSVIIPSTVTQIGSYAFNGCNNLNAHLKATIPPTVGSQPFSWWANIYVPSVSLTVYKDAWGSDYEYIYGE